MIYLYLFIFWVVTFLKLQQARSAAGTCPFWPSYFWRGPGRWWQWIQIWRVQMWPFFCTSLPTSSDSWLRDVGKILVWYFRMGNSWMGNRGEMNCSILLQFVASNRTVTAICPRSVIHRCVRKWEFLHNRTMWAPAEEVFSVQKIVESRPQAQQASASR